MKPPLRILLPVLTLTGLAHAADLTSIGDWTQSVSAVNLVSGAGSDLQSPLQSISGVTTLTISNAPGAWVVRIRRNPGQWDSNVILHAKRTSGGSGSGTISGGNTYVEVSGSDSELFSGSESRSGIAIQFKLTGLSRRVSPATYLSSIIFTVQ